MVNEFVEMTEPSIWMQLFMALPLILLCILILIIIIILLKEYNKEDLELY